MFADRFESGLVNGAKGVMPWSIYHMVDSPVVRAKKKAEGKPAWEEWYLPDSKALWAECGALASDLNTLAPLLLDGKRTKLTDGGDITAAIWQGKTESLVIVVNLSEKEAKPVSLTLPKGITGEFKSAFPDRPAGLKWAEGKLTGEIGKAEVCVYRITDK